MDNIFTPDLPQSKYNPDYYTKKIQLRPSILKKLGKKEKENAVNDINKAIYADIGNYGDLVAKARGEIVIDYMKAKAQGIMSDVKAEQEAEQIALDALKPPKQ